MIMKKENMELKEVIKAAILEAFAEMYGVATVEETDDQAPEDGESSEGGNKGHGNNNNNGNSDESSGGGSHNGRPIPDVGVGTFGRR